MQDDIRAKLIEIAINDGASFEELVEIAGLDPATSFRGADLSGADLGHADLRGYDFTNANLSGARLEKAQIAGAVFDDATTVRTRWPSTARVRPRPGKLRDDQEAVTRALVGALGGSQSRVAALMPPGSGRQAVLREVLSRLFRERRWKRVAVFVQNTLERAQMLNLLGAGLPEATVDDGRAPTPGAAVPHILVFLARGYGTGLRNLRKAMDAGLSFDLIFSLDLSGVQRLIDVATADGPVPIVALVAPPFINNTDETRRERRTLKMLFGEPVASIAVERLLADGHVRQANVVVPTRLEDVKRWTHFGKSVPSSALFAVAEHLYRLATELRVERVAALCRNAAAANVFADALSAKVAASGQRYEIRVMINEGTTRRPPEQEPMTMAVTNVTATGIELCGRADCVAVLTQLGSEIVQQLALRPKHMRHERLPMIIDYAGSFRELPSIHSDVAMVEEFLGISPLDRLSRQPPLP